MTTKLQNSKIAPAEFIGIQDTMGVCESFALYHLLEDIPGHPKGSAVSEYTLRDLGYKIPGDSLQ